MLNQSKPTLAFNLKPGTRLVGKWKRNSYVIQQVLGKGAIGAVYLAKQSDKKLVALKISDKVASISSEINVLQKLAKVRGNSPGPSLYEVDDWLAPDGICYPFYTMEYVQGSELSSFLNNRGSAWLGLLLSQLLEELDQLHQIGFIVGDLKLENVIVTNSPIRLRFIDVGGVTQIGRSVKEYTEFYDRGYWQCGDRKAEPSYDLFALAMLALQCVYPNRFKKTEDAKGLLLAKIKQAKVLSAYELVLSRAVSGRYQTAISMRQDLKKVLILQTKVEQPTATVHKGRSQNRDWLEIFMFGLSSLIFYLLTAFY
ncbi:serine/threonine protein kinase [Amphibacillus marinus]|uniref:Serine/threonine protein kinase n=1 Tax=Amphibacillus marinus TaxID=872970 RepID=A0A1H8TLF0_9BACI|nr:protein kinase [Amphibacillus marinus]SEO91413.1 serine/threonine protein kinase [Amphibacillus marinus]